MDVSTESTTALQTAPQNPGQISIFSSSPRETIVFATELANALAPIIDKQGMFSTISGKRHVKVEAWLTLGAMLGITPRETGVKELHDGSFEAHVDLLNQSGRVVGGASALCGVEEKRWATADRYARRSMAVTRATAKAFRIAFSWIVCLAGYETTPFEEMPTHESPRESPRGNGGRVDIDPPYDRIPKYRHADKDAQDWIKAKLEGTSVPRAGWKDFSMGYNGQYMTDLAFETAVAKWQKGADA